jgi:predicted RNA-binding protein with TRAM domain
MCTYVFNIDSTDAIQLQVGKEYEADVTQIGSRGDGITRIKSCVIFIKGGTYRRTCQDHDYQTRNSRFAMQERRN